MSTKNYICILACTALLVSCAPEQKPKAPTTTTAARPTPTPRPRPTPHPGKRTEQGTVIKLTTSQITLQCADGTWIINRTVNTVIKSGTLKVGSIVTVEFNEADGQLLPA